MHTRNTTIFVLITIALATAIFGGYAAGKLIPSSVLIPGLPPLARVSISPQTQNGVTLSIDAAYVDALRVLFVVRAPIETVGGFDLKNADGEIINAATNSQPIDAETTLIEFDMTAPLPEQLSGTLEIAAAPYASDGTPAATFSFPLDFPVLPARTFDPKQSATDYYTSIILDRIIISPSYTLAYLCYIKPSAKDWMISHDATLEIGNQTGKLFSYELLFDSDYGDMGKSPDPNWTLPVQKGRCVRIGFPVGDADPSSFTLNIPTLEQPPPEVIPPEQVVEAQRRLKLYENIELEWHTEDHGAYPEWKKLPRGMTEQEAYGKFMKALGYTWNRYWQFKVQLKPQPDVAPVFFTSTYGAPAPIFLSESAPKVVATLPGDIASFDVSPDKKTIAMATSRGAFIYDVESAKLQRKLNEDENIFKIVWSPDGTKLAVESIDDSDGKARLTIWNTANWKTIVLSGDIVQALNAPDAIAWSPDSKQIAINAYENDLGVFDLETGELVSMQENLAGVSTNIAWSPDGTRLVANGDLGFGIRRWRMDTDEWVRLYNGRVDRATNLVWSPDGTRIASAHQNGIVCFWTVKTNDCEGFIQAQSFDSVTSLAWSPDGKRLATSETGIRIWDTQFGSPLATFGQTMTHYRRIEWLSDNTLAALFLEVNTWVDRLLIFDVTTGQALFEFNGTSRASDN